MGAKLGQVVIGSIIFLKNIHIASKKSYLVIICNNSQEKLPKSEIVKLNST